MHDIDFYVPSNAISKLEHELNNYLIFGPEHHQDKNWDIYFMKLSYNGQQIEIGDAENTRYYDSHSQKWIKEEINFEQSNVVKFEDIKLPVMPKHQLIKYKQRLNRKVDQIDIQEILS